jgi:hypothetical protein
MDPAQTTIPEIAIDLPLARKMLARVAPPIEPLAGIRGMVDGF